LEKLQNVMKVSIQSICLPLATILTALMPGLLPADELRVADVFTDHAVLQQGVALPVW
jgi:hypothetical protein